MFLYLDVSECVMSFVVDISSSRWQRDKRNGVFYIFIIHNMQEQKQSYIRIEECFDNYFSFNGFLDDYLRIYG